MTNAQPLDDIGLQFTGDGAVATIKLTGPVQYQRHFPENKGKFLEIYYDRAPGAAKDEEWVDNEVRNSPPTSRIPSFSVTTRNQRTQPKLEIEFSRETEYTVMPGKDGRSFLLIIKSGRDQADAYTPLPRLPAVGAAPVVAANADLDAVANSKQARELMIKGRDALASKRNEEAIEAFNQLLLLMPNEYTQDAQEWVGVARERAGHEAKAKIEYELYLKLYGSDEGASRVRQRLAGLGRVTEEKVKLEGAPEKKDKARLITFGGISSRYYFGTSNVDTSYVFNNASTTDTYSETDQSSLVTSVDLSERYLGEEYDGRLVFRDVLTQNFIASQPNTNRVYAAYAEVKGRTQSYLLRAGRQSSTGAGVLGRFDGVSGGYGDAEDWRINASVGVLDDFSQGAKPTFAGASLDRGPVSVYFVNQKLESQVDRRALGVEYRYFESDKTAYTLLDYDTYFRELNTVMFMGTLSVGSSTSYNLMLDHRKSPTMSIRSALTGATTSSIDTLAQSMTADELRKLAVARTATSNFAQLGITQALTKQWQVGGDVRLSSISGTSASGHTIDPNTSLPITQCTGTPTLEGCIEAQPGLGLEKTLTGQLIGSNLYRDQDIWSASLSLSRNSLRDGRSLYLFSHQVFAQRWTLDASWQYYWQNDQVNGSLTRNSPMLRGSYQLRDRFSIDADAGLDFTSTSGATSSAKSVRKFFSAGLRWDF
ncbi:MAG: hypothetical protein KJ795_12800 [Gammaproteobacteria bacterium]|nr:hypothetical protein [Gammaproteobacteria bacterium]MBU1775484.1 hypothetical protein [Gammaproteobacteria bacterium]MBU1968257.1 hypothetical protein [Gammaproteobacteria bacterium]